VISIRDLIDKDVISPEDATELIAYVEQGKISLSHAYSLLNNILEENK
jgi:Asp-tRNA(Asn)/Glu-tRNA(Gln) amidotransferase B subunit